MRVLLDENLPLEFAVDLPQHSVSTVRGLGWSGIQNGDLMRRAASVCDVFVTMDTNLPHQQNLRALPFGVIVVKARSNRLVHLRPLIGELLIAMTIAKPGKLQRVGT